MQCDFFETLAHRPRYASKSTASSIGARTLVRDHNAMQDYNESAMKFLKRRASRTYKRQFFSMFNAQAELYELSSKTTLLSIPSKRCFAVPQSLLFLFSFFAIGRAAMTMSITHQFRRGVSERRFPTHRNSRLSTKRFH